MPKPKPEMLGTGMARAAGEAGASRSAYLAYAEDEQLQGRKPLSFDDWMKRKKRGQPVMETTLRGG